MRLLKLTTIATLTLLVGCSDATTEGEQTQDAAAFFPTQDVTENLDAGTTDTQSADSGLLDSESSDVGVLEDSAPPVPQDGGTGDLDAAGDVSAMDTNVPDTAPIDVGAEDVADEPDNGAAEDVVEECVPPVPMDCDPSGSWTVNIQTAAAPGEGCSDDGAPAQSPSTHIYSVTSTGNGLYKVKMLEPNDGNPISSLQAFAKPGSCTVSFTTTVAVTVPGAGDIEGGTASILYAYSLTKTDATFTGPGSVTTAFVTDSGTTLSECTEVLSAEGVLIP